MKFTNIGEVLKDKACCRFLNRQVTGIAFKRQAIGISKLKRSPINYLEEKGLFNPRDLINEYVGILGKKSQLPRGVRDLVVSIVRQSIQETIQFYDNRAEDNTDIS